MTGSFFSIWNLKGGCPISRHRRIVGYRHPLKTARKKEGHMGEKSDNPVHFS
jgi:hypothetical protein